MIQFGMASFKVDITLSGSVTFVFKTDFGRLNLLARGHYSSVPSTSLLSV